MNDALTWRVSTFTNNGQCVEVAAAGDDVLVRNSNARDAGTLALTRAQFAVLLDRARSGELDHMT